MSTDNTATVQRGAIGRPVNLRSFNCPLCCKRRPHAGAHIRHVLGVNKLVCWRHRKVAR